MRTIVAIPLCVASSIASGFLTTIVMNPLGHADLAQRAIIEEFVAAYCHPDRSKEPGFLIGGAAALSRVSIKAGIGTLAFSEYAKCKVGG